MGTVASGRPIETHEVPFGVYGVLADDGDRAQCHECGRWYRHLGNHVVIKHMPADEYRVKFGLCMNTGLIGPGLAAIRSRDSSRPERLEKLKAIQWKEAPPPSGTNGSSSPELRLKRMEQHNERGSCVGCGREIWMSKNPNKKSRRRSCGQESCKKMAMELAHTEESRRKISDAQFAAWAKVDRAGAARSLEALDRGRRNR